MQKTIGLNWGWTVNTLRTDEGNFKAGAGKSAGSAGSETACTEKSVNIPHSSAYLNYNYINSSDYQKTLEYKKSVFIEDAWKGSVLLLRFEGVAHKAVVMVNGKRAGEHLGGYTAFSVAITNLVEYGAENEVVVIVDSSENLDIPPFGGAIDYLTYGGIYREVFLEVLPSVYISDVFAKPSLVGRNTGEIEVEVTVECGSSTEGRMDVRALADISTIGAIGEEVLIPSPSTSSSTGSIPTPTPNQTQGLSAGSDEGPTPNLSTQKVVFKETIKNIKAWDLESPNLYELSCYLLDSKGDVLHKTSTKIGFRNAEFTPKGFFLNGKKVPLRGLNRHQSYPIIGYATPKRLQETDAEIIKRELSCNIVRTSHYPQSKHFINKCDEVGLLVFTEIPGWQHIGTSPAWRGACLENVCEMVTQYRNHPSIVLWGVRVNESPDCDELYAKTNEIAHELNPTRQTSGVRNFENSHLLEDVYAYNDFSHAPRISGSRQQSEGILDKRVVVGGKDVPYLVSECNGHMYPTKAFDSAKRRVQQAFRHLQVMSDAAAKEGVSGVIGWCAFDYNTHNNFGSGDSVCYHGVMDMFRNPKFAAFAYASQGEVGGCDGAGCDGAGGDGAGGDVERCGAVSAGGASAASAGLGGAHGAGNAGASAGAIAGGAHGAGYVLEVSPSLGNTEFSAMTPQPVVVLSNVNSIKVYENDEFLVQVYPAKRHFVGLSHPPFILPNLAAFKIARGESMPIKQAVKFIKLATNVVERSKFHLKASDKLKILAFCKRNKLTLDDFAALVVKYLFPIDSKYKTWRFVGLDESGKEVITKCVSEVRIPRLRVIVGASHYVMSDSESGSGSLDANGESGSCVEADSCVEAESRKPEPIEPIELIGDNSYEAELIRIQVTDQFGNVLSYFSEPIILETSGEIEVIGESIIPLKGGLGGTFVKTTKESGVGAKLASQTPSKTASLKVSCPAINQSVKVSFTVHKTDRP